MNQEEETEYIIYTKSRCSFCVKLKDFLKKEGKTFSEQNCDELLKNEYNKTHFLNWVKSTTNKNWNTFPIVFRYDEFIGGYTETCDYINRQNAFEHNYELY
jgi:glutaredoxin